MNRTQPGTYILLPASPLFIAFSFLVAFLLNLQPWGRIIGMPDFVALCLVFWGIHQPRRVGMGTAFCMGLLMDVNNAVLLGENALAYVLLSYFVITIHRRVLWFPVRKQALHVLPLLLISQLIQMFVQFVVNDRFTGWFYLLDSFVAAVLWPVVTVILLAPQRRAADKDPDRPL
ncbi:MAG: rod shape-determining protein MreD [Burkholderiaceae bacterium]|jgi:rod shape-determining protein MreD|nr:rod shape-determining protein MreD [Burkholderiaceae bacterium]